MAEVGCYNVHLYCDNITDGPDGEPGVLLRKHYWSDGIHKFNSMPHEYTGISRGSCRKQARRHGWIFKRNGAVICPRCAHRKPQDAQD